MGCDIHSKVHLFRDGRWRPVEAKLFPRAEYDGLFYPEPLDEPSPSPFDWRSYGMFGFLAGVRNYSFVPSLSEPRGFPSDMAGFDPEKTWEYGEHSFSWLGLFELLAFNYDATFEDRRCTRDGSGAADSGPGNGTIVTFREFLGLRFFRDLLIMQCLGKPSQTRLVFGFDN